MVRPFCSASGLWLLAALLLAAPALAQEEAAPAAPIVEINGQQLTDTACE